MALPLLLILTVRLAAQPADGQQALTQDWHYAATAAGLNLKAIQHLEKEKVLMTKDDFFQCFQAYLPSYGDRKTADTTELPYFITSDALFQAYCWCLQKAVANLEQMHAEQTAEYLDVVMKSLSQVDATITGDPATILVAKERAMFVIGVAAALMDLKTDLPESLKGDVDYEVTKIRLAMGSGIPRRLKLPSSVFSELDYTIFKPASFYATDATLSGYFRAIRWLQLIPFRLSSDEDMLAVAMINIAQEFQTLSALKLNDKVTELWKDRQNRMERLAGPTARLVLIGGYYLEPKDRGKPQPMVASIKSARDWYGLVLTPRDGRERDDEAISSTLQTAIKDEVCVYIAPASKLVDAVLIEKLSKSKGETYFPNALSVASWLGSSYAADCEGADEKSLQIRAEAQKLIDGSEKYPNLHAQSLRVLQRLFEPLPDDAPAFMKGRAWQAKTCQTALAGWAQARHVWALQAQPQYSVGSAMEEWPAFIEPHPDFFSGLAGLCHEAEWEFRRAREDYDPSHRIAKQLRKMADDYKAGPGKDPAHNEQRMTIGEMLFNAGAPQDLDDVDQILRESAELIEKGRAGDTQSIASQLKAHLSKEMTAPFKSLEETCLRLASLAHKQMRGLSPREEEYDWLQYFGVTLSGFTDCHFSSARDNVPKSVRVFTNPMLQRALTVGIGRPTFLYVLYPWKGKEILCRGAVLPYLEHHEMKTFTDAEWQAKLGHPEQSPIQPEWLKPLMAE
ncbi:MAG: DUF3160 domain-containing protein [Verrucomicrobiota bacterium]